MLTGMKYLRRRRLYHRVTRGSTMTNIELSLNHPTTRMLHPSHSLILLTVFLTSIFPESIKNL